jgi:hypothetical protein
MSSRQQLLFEFFETAPESSPSSCITANTNRDPVAEGDSSAEALEPLFWLRERMAPPECNMRQHANVTQQTVPDPIVAPNTVPLTDGANTAKAAPAKSTATPAAGIRLVQDNVADNGIIIITGTVLFHL